MVLHKILSHRVWPGVVWGHSIQSASTPFVPFWITNPMRPSIAATFHCPLPPGPHSTTIGSAGSVCNGIRKEPLLKLTPLTLPPQGTTPSTPIYAHCPSPLLTTPQNPSPLLTNPQNPSPLPPRLSQLYTRLHTTAPPPSPSPDGHECEDLCCVELVEGRWTPTQPVRHSPTQQQQQ